MSEWVFHLETPPETPTARVMAERAALDIEKQAARERFLRGLSMYEYQRYPVKEVATGA